MVIVVAVVVNVMLVSLLCMVVGVMVAIDVLLV